MFTKKSIPRIKSDPFKKSSKSSDSKEYIGREPKLVTKGTVFTSGLQSCIGLFAEIYKNRKLKGVVGWHIETFYCFQEVLKNGKKLIGKTRECLNFLEKFKNLVEIAKQKFKTKDVEYFLYLSTPPGSSGTDNMSLGYSEKPIYKWAIEFFESQFPYSERIASSEYHKVIN